MARLLRWLAVVGMGLAFLEFALAAAEWAAPNGSSRPWVGKRMKDAVEPPAPAGQVRPVSTGGIVGYSRFELTSLYQNLRGPSIWFCVAGLLYLSASRQLADRRRDAEPS